MDNPTTQTQITSLKACLTSMVEAAEMASKSLGKTAQNLRTSHDGSALKAEELSQRVVDSLPEFTMAAIEISGSITRILEQACQLEVATNEMVKGVQGLDTHEATQA